MVFNIRIVIDIKHGLMRTLMRKEEFNCIVYVLKMVL